jgi:hypothetical protein
LTCAAWDNCRSAWVRDTRLVFLPGEPADLGERIKPLDLYRCEKCGRLEFYGHNFSLPER